MSTDPGYSRRVPDYLDALVHKFEEQGWKRLGQRQGPHIAGPLFLREDLISGSGNDQRTMAVLVSPLHGYMLRLFLTARTPEALANVFMSASSLRINPDWESDTAAALAQTNSSHHPLKVRVSAGVLQANQTTRVQPQYPPKARQDGISGSVILSVLLNTEGNIKRLYVLEGDPELVSTAVEAVRQWRYKPYLIDGQPVEVESLVGVDFKR